MRNRKKSAFHILAILIPELRIKNLAIALRDAWNFEILHWDAVLGVQLNLRVYKQFFGKAHRLLRALSHTFFQQKSSNH